MSQMFSHIAVFCQRLQLRNALLMSGEAFDIFAYCYVQVK